jgi:predicted transcriptional regulator
MARFCKSMDPFEIQKRFSAEEYSFYRLDESNFHLEDFKPFISKLPQREIDLIEMYYKKNKKQKEIANFFGVTQGAVSHRLSRARKRLAFLRDMPKLTQDIRAVLEDHFTAFEIDVILYMIETTCQSKTASILNEQYKLEGRDQMTQVKVRHKFDRATTKLNKLKKANPELKDVLDLVKYIKNNLYMLHEVVLPHFDKGYKVKIKGIH